MMKKPTSLSLFQKTFSSLSDLKKVQKQLKAHIKLKEEEKKQQKKQTHKAQADQSLFRQSMKGVQPLKVQPRAALQQPKPKPIPIQKQEDDKQVLHDSISDEFDIESLLDTDEALSFRRNGIGPEIIRKLRRGYWKIQDELDLHGYRRDGARNALNEFLRESVKNGLRCVRIIHGKGHGSPGKTPILKARVLSALAQKQEVLAYTQARGSDGGAGALIVLLKDSPHK